MDTNLSNNPKAFISHASEDKNRFVDAFAEALTNIGIDPWYDKWEIKAGDSLVSKIFDEGIKDATVFVIVLSENSVAKPWVKEELSAAVVKRIQEKCLLIPVQLDDCEIPVALRHIKWVVIEDLENWQEQLDEIKHSVFEVNLKPKINEVPTFAQSEFIDFDPDISGTDAVVFAEYCQQYLDEGQRLITDDKVRQKLLKSEISDVQIRDSLGILEESCYIECHRGFGGSIHSILISTSAIDLYLRHTFEHYQEFERTIISMIVNENLFTTRELSERTRFSEPIVNHFLQNLTDNGLVKSTKTYGGQIQIFDVSVRLKRSLQ